MFLSVQNSTWMASRLTAIASFRNIFFQLLQYSRQHPSSLVHWVALMTKTDSIYPAFSLRFVDFAVQFCFCYKFSFHEKWQSNQVWQWHDLPKPITILCKRIATNEIASFCIDQKWRQMAFLVFVKMGKAPLLRLTWNKAAFMRTKFNSLLYKTNRFHVAVHLSSNRSQMTSKCGKNITDTLGYCLVCHFFVLTTFWHHLWSTVLLDRCTAT